MDCGRLTAGPGEHGIVQRVAGLLARAGAGIGPAAHSHREALGEVLARRRIAGSDVGPESRARPSSARRICSGRPCISMRMRCCWLQVRGAQLVEPADFGVDPDLFHDRRVARGDRLDLGVGERPAIEVLGGAHRDAAGHHLLDEAGLRLQGLPHVGVERAFRDIAVDPHFRVEVALAQDAPLALSGGEGGVRVWGGLCHLRSTFRG